jgi:bifunctional ADP-heptose synthase (sugar kinase/adenylyltransferase)
MWYVAGMTSGPEGASNNTCVFCQSLGADSILVTLTGADPEGDRVAEILAESHIATRQLRANGIQTVTRIRVFVFREDENRFEMLYRVDKDPDAAASYRLAEQVVQDQEVLDWFEGEAKTADVILFNDTDKGFLSAGTLAAFGARILAAKEHKASIGKSGPLVIVDPKTKWEKYLSLDVDILKPNHIEACTVLNHRAVDREGDDSLRKFGATELIDEKNLQHYLKNYQSPRSLVGLSAGF